MEKMSDATLESPSRGNDRRILIILSVFISFVAVVILVVAAIMLSLIISRIDNDKVASHAGVSRGARISSLSSSPKSSSSPKNACVGG